MLDALITADQQLFLLLNDLHQPWLDPIMNWITGRKEWIPFYALLFGWIFWKYRWQGLWVAFFIGITIGLADQFASTFCKPFFGRLRPCHEPNIAAAVHLVHGCGGKYGFISSHAANTFGLAAFLSLVGGKEVKWLRWIFLWAAVVSYSRIYVGVHYPADIIIGGLSGIFWGWVSYQGYCWLPPKVRKVSGINPKPS